VVSWAKKYAVYEKNSGQEKGSIDCLISLLSKRLLDTGFVAAPREFHAEILEMSLITKTMKL